MNLFHRFSNGAAKVSIIFKLPNFFAKIFQFSFPCFSLCKNFWPRQPPVFQMGVQRYDFFLYFQIFLILFCDFFDIKILLKAYSIDIQEDK